MYLIIKGREKEPLGTCFAQLTTSHNALISVGSPHLQQVAQHGARLQASLVRRGAARTAS